MWEALKRELETRKSDFRKEGCVSLFRARYMESRSFARMGEEGELRRSMYIVTRA
jgi:hypothetical protein